MIKNIESERWITIYYRISAASQSLIKLKNDMENYARELNWEVFVDKKGYINSDGRKMYEVTVKPRDDIISPEKMFENLDLLIGFAFSMHNNILYGKWQPDVKPKLISNWSLSSISGKWVYEMNCGGIFFIEGELKNFIELEKKNYNLTKTILFNNNPSEMYKESIKVIEKRFNFKKNKLSSENLIKTLEEEGMQKITPKQKKLKISI